MGQKLLLIIGLFALAHAGYSAAQHRVYVRLTEQQFERLPADIIVQTLIAFLACCIGTVQLFGKFKPILITAEWQNKTWDTIGNRPSFMTFNHRVCVDSFESALAAVQGGAQRIELCSSLDQGGLTPSLGLLTLIRRHLPSELIIFVMIRCRSGDFVYDNNEINVMKEEIRSFIQSNQRIDGFVLGLLNPDGTIDIENLKSLIEQIPKDYSLTFHRAFDFLAKWQKSIDQLIELGFHRILTSGQETTAYYGRKSIRQMINYADNRIIILPGCGINVTNLESVLRETGAKEFHSSARIRKPSKMIYKNFQKRISLNGQANDDEDNSIQVTDREKKQRGSFAYYHSDSIEEPPDEPVYEEQRLSSYEATKILRTHEASIDLEANCPVKYYEVNYLGANNPPEDRQAQARIRSIDSYMYLFGVFDGHGGPWCSDAVGQSLFEYIAVSLHSPDELEPILRKGKTMTNSNKNSSQNSRNISSLLLRSYYNAYKDARNSKTKEVHQNNLLKHIEEVYTSFDNDNTDIMSALESAFIKLDRDICTEAIPNAAEEMNEDLLHISTAGSCACVALVKDADLYIANCGDARAILGTIDDNGNPSVVSLSIDHNVRNENEVKRILSEHPSNESHSVIRSDRLLGLLMPFRAFGDIRLKWPINSLREYLQPYYKKGDAIPQFYFTPPYLTARPEITKHKLTKKDKFLVLATDGLWDLLSPEKVVELIFNHQKGIQSFDRFILNKTGTKKSSLKLKEISELLTARQQAIKNQPIDQNSATDLIRHALAFTSKGQFDSKLLSDVLTFPNPRSIRDDITVTIVYFDQDHIDQIDTKEKQTGK
ncbi:unnamed protein product [Adineta steineri]|uniref:Copper homeostasis protein cutC homolog n=1 Tax=Adineta steineri TaxID=433720 RepID=A0A814YQU8_9BILA|nr:unnamed protein product [Adineta steineri]